MSAAIVAIEDLTFRYDEASAPVLRHVGLTLQAGEVVLVLGPSGSGKSTLLLCLNGIIPQHIAGEFSGRVTVAGRDVAQHHVYEMAEHVGIVFQDPEAQFCTLYVEDEVAFGLENLRYPREVMRQRVAWALQQVGMADRADARLDRLSGGQKQKVALAAALAMDPAILVFDAPTANLDPASARDFYTLLRRLHRETGKTLVIVEQHLDECIDMADRLVLLNEHGQVVGNGPPRKVLASIDPAMWETYGLWMPQVWEIARTLDQQGTPVALFPLTIAEALNDLPPLLNGNVNGRHAPAWGSTVHDARTHDGQPAVIEVQGLSHTYMTPTGGTQALHDVTLAITAGAFCAIVGQNGAGKTTLAKFLTRILEPPPGRVFFQGHDIADVPLRRLIRQIGYVFQNPEHQFVANTVYDELAYSLRVRGSDEATVRARVLETLDRFHLRAVARSRPFTLSRGEQRRLSVATMLITDPEVLILDEPTMGLDRTTAALLMNTLRERNACGTTILCITHDMRLVAEYAHSVIVMADGMVRFQGSVRALFEHPEVMSAAALLAPPVVTLAQHLRRIHPAFPPIVSVRELQQWLEVA